MSCTLIFRLLQCAVLQKLTRVSFGDTNGIPNCNLHNTRCQYRRLSDNMALASSTGDSTVRRSSKTRVSLTRSSRKNLFILAGLSLVAASGCTRFNGELPADFPADVPIISGEIYRARSATFEDGRGFVVDVLTTVSYEEVVAFYDDVVGPRGNGYVRVETTCRDTPTRYVSIAVHLGRGPNSRLPSGFIPDTVQCLMI